MSKLYEGHMARYKLSDYIIAITQEDDYLEIVATVDGKNLLSHVGNIGVFQWNILTRQETDSNNFEDSWYNFSSTARASRAFKAAVNLCEHHEKDVIRALNEDRAECEWDFPSDKKEAE